MCSLHSSASLFSAGDSRRLHRACCCFDRSCSALSAGDTLSSKRTSCIGLPANRPDWEHWAQRSADSYEADARRYSAGVMPVARLNARVKLDCEENRQTKAVLAIDVPPAAIIAFAHSRRLWLT